MSPPSKTSHQNENGNILFLILLAVVLFAALAYAVTSSMRGGGRDASNEAQQTMVSQMLQYGGLIENVFMRQMLASDVREYAFDLSGNGCSAATNATCTKSDCRMFDSTAGNWAGLAGSCQPLPAKWSATGVALPPVFRFVNVVNIGTSKEDVILMYNNVTLPLCQAINAQMGITLDVANTNEGWGGTIANYDGTMTSLPANGSVIGDELPVFAHKKAGCFRHTNGNYIYYYVVMER